jgi:hypothetical protein
MPKSTGPLQEQLGIGTANQTTPKNFENPGTMTDNTTAAADKLGANKATDAIPQSNPSVISSAGAIGKQCMYSSLFFSFLPIFMILSYLHSSQQHMDMCKME